MQLPAHQDAFPLSAQQGAVLNRQDRLGRPLYAFVRVRIVGALDASRLCTLLDELQRRHEILRTRYLRMDGLRRPVQVVEQAVVSPLRAARAGEAGEVVRSALAQVAFAAAVVEEAGDARSFVVLLGASLASVDAWALQHLAQVLRQGYDSGLPAADDEALQYIDYASWQGELIAEAIGVQGAAYWRGVQEAASPRAPLPFEREASATGVDHVEVPAGELLHALDRRAGALGMPADDLLLFLWGGFLCRLADQPQVALTVVLDGRNDQVQHILGRFERRLPLNLAFAADASLARLLDDMRGRLDEARSWLECLDEVAVAGHGEADGYGFSAECRQLAGIDVEHDAAFLPLLSLGRQGLMLRLEHAAQRLETSVAALWLEQFCVFAGNALGDLDQRLAQVCLLGPQERARIAAFEQGPTMPLASPGLLHRLFEAQVARQQHREAVRQGNESLDYATLERRANQLARALQAEGVGRERIVGVYARRSLSALVAMLGILKAGGAYLPLDPDYPAERLSFMLADAGVHCLLSLDPLDAELALPAGLTVLSLAHGSSVWQGPAEPLPVTVAGDDLAYVIYTSGSTGTPKGVAVSHANALASTLARFVHYQAPVESFLLLSSLSFDSSVAGLFWTLGQGGCLHLPTAEQARDPRAIARLLGEQRISHYLALPGLHGEVLEQLGEQSLRAVVVAGEACTPALVARHRERLPATLLSNEYGPTEGSVWCSAWNADTGPVSIGRPAPGMRVLVLDANLEPVAVGQIGELYVAGPGVTRGYLDRPALTAERYPTLADGSRGYRTGDLARWRSDGLLEFLGRVDAQVKIRGYRIELGEVEAVLASCEGVGEAAVVVREAPSGAQLVAFVVTRADETDEQRSARLQAQLALRLPAHMIPSAVRRLERLPLMPNGKVDRRALAAEAVVEQTYQAPQTALQRILAEVWQDALGVERVGLQDNFFALGGHSLLATRLRARLQEQMGIELPLRLFFEGETLERFAAKVAELQQAPASDLDALENLFAEVEAP
ncbi:amino acid adenylation domain-containing protein [Pseudomonas sp. GD03860]|uniref:non-ribosomal peptide synthetase n=1 Tax=Pseudomonas TaxID=286 RepID=UPI0023645759|nr:MULTISPECIES: non-ribosomal peptide synthetase [Pseudomonas]MDD2058574.1 amino acid adenylation domain-containing protein [Pseudomonas putida]MDH0639561.1 amino acid adenylation domain-containing protein [Pseudomonas sp. GD03860]